MDKISNLLKADRRNTVSKVESLIEELKIKEKEINTLKSKMAKSIAEDILDKKQVVDGINLLAYKVENMDANNLRNLGII